MAESVQCSEVRKRTFSDMIHRESVYKGQLCGAVKYLNNYCFITQAVLGR